ncbi:MAG: hypothetical protein KQJ78_06265 [Deltaproteobacteria bacterium]|nr:hypothetical protein [Deltaproteobacteria bacterium]
MTENPDACRFMERPRERDRIGVWGFGNVSRDVVLTLVKEDLGKEIVFYGRPKEGYPDRAGAWVEDLKANTPNRPRFKGTNRVEDMAGLDLIFVGVGVPRREGQSRDDLLAVNTGVIAQTAKEIRELYRGCGSGDLPVLVFMGNPVTAMTWVAYQVTGFPRQNILGQAGNLDTRRICHSIARVMGLSGGDVKGVVFGDHGDSMVASPHFFSVSGIPLLAALAAEGIDPARIREVMDDAKKGGTHYVNAVGQSASAGPAKAAVDMLRPMIRGEWEVQPVVAVLEDEYGLLSPEDDLDSLCFGVPAVLGPHGVQKIYQLNVDEIRDQVVKSAENIKGNIRVAARVLKEKHLLG